MKLKHILGLALGVLLTAACSDSDELGSLAGLSTDQTFLVIPESGGDVTVNISAADAWQLFGLYQKIVKNDDGTRDTTYTPLPNSPAWLTADKVNGPAGQSTLTLHADATEAGREAEVCISMGGYRQYLKVRQGSLEATDATCADVAAAPDGKTMRVRAQVMTDPDNQYGNYDIADETGTVYIYGTYDKEGKKGNYPISGTDGWGFEIGDIITVEGPKLNYNGKIEMTDVTVIAIEKSLLKIITPEQKVSIDGGFVDVKLAYKGSGAYTTVPADCDWVKYIDTDYLPGTADIFNPNPADTAIVHLYVAPNAGNARTADIEFSSSMLVEDESGKSKLSTSAIIWSIKQEAFILPHGETADDPFTVAEAIAKCQEIGATTDGGIYYARGIISSIKEVSTSYGNATYNISDDGTDDHALTCYRSLSLDNQKFASEDEIGVGDEVLVCGKLVNFTRDGASFTPEFSGNVYIVSRKSAAEVNKPGTRLNPFTPAQANAFVSGLEAGVTTEDDYYIQGEICKIKYTFSADYGTATFFISEDGDPESEQFQIYSCYYFDGKPWVDGNTQIEVGDAVTICGKLVNYNGNTPETASKKAYIYKLNGRTN